MTIQRKIINQPYHDGFVDGFKAGQQKGGTSAQDTAMINSQKKEIERLTAQVGRLTITNAKLHLAIDTLHLVDTRLHCFVCKSDFVYTADDRERHAESGLRIQPSRCRRCRANKRKMNKLVAEMQPTPTPDAGTGEPAPAPEWIDITRESRSQQGGESE